MSLSMMRGIRLSLWLSAAGTIIAAGAHAQTYRPALPQGSVVQPLQPGQGMELRRHLTTLADNPRNLEALIGAGRAALAGGDTQAALTFFSRAGEVAPRDSRVKAGMASVLVRMERGQPALNLFAEAAALGAPPWEIAGDRGLAYDMIGDPRRAQQDYAFVLQRREDPEVRRRLALSLAISGEKEAALRVIEGQLRRNDRAAWRTQAFILALTGDSAGANQTAQGLMPAPAAQAMAPFFARLSTLSPSQKAMAAHFGRFPSSGRIASGGAADIRADPGALALAGGGQPLRPRSQPAEPAASTATRRRPGASPGTSRPAPAQAPQPEQAREARQRTEPTGRPTLMQQRRALAEAERRGASSGQGPTTRPAANRATQPARTPPASAVETRIQPAAANPVPSETQPAQARPVEPAIVAQSQPVQIVTQPDRSEPAVAEAPASPTNALTDIELSSLPSSQPVVTNDPRTLSPAKSPADAPRSAPLNTAELSASAPPSEPQAAVSETRIAAASDQPAITQPVTTPADASPRPAEPAAESRASLSDIAALVATLPEDEARPSPAPAAARSATPPPARPTANRSTPTSTRNASATPARARPAHPSRHWVQIAGGANAAALPRELARLRGLAPELANRNAWVTPLNATNRLLVGPFASVAEAQEFVNTLARRNVSAFAWTSEAGQEIARLQPGR